ncbi:MAG: hypothetical protein Q4D12_09290 [Bacteroidales bacterium]|nr:hypothetical protein [Bacteroidales bacterium]
MLGKPKYKCGDVVSFVAWTPLVDLPFGGHLDESNTEKEVMLA